MWIICNEFLYIPVHDKSHNLDIEGKELLLRIIFLSVLWHIPNIMTIQDVVNHGYTDFFFYLGRYSKAFHLHFSRLWILSRPSFRLGTLLHTTKLERKKKTSFIYFSGLFLRKWMEEIRSEYELRPTIFFPVPTDLNYPSFFFVILNRADIKRRFWEA